MHHWFCVCGRTFGGFANSQNTRDELLKLIESLKRDGMSFKEAPYYRVGYDSPFKLVNRRNEVWLIQEEGKEWVGMLFTGCIGEKGQNVGLDCIIPN